MKKFNLYPPFLGEIKPLESVPDEVFSKRMVGDGIAILPNSSEIYAPANGIIKKINNHAIVIELESEDFHCSLLIHIGINTVELEDGYFHYNNLKSGSKITRGQKLGTFELEALKKLITVENKMTLLSPIIFIDQSFNINSKYGINISPEYANGGMIKDLEKSILTIFIK